MLSLNNSLDEATVLAFRTQNMVNSSTNHLSSVTSNHVEHLVVELDFQESVILLIDDGILVTGF